MPSITIEHRTGKDRDEIWCWLEEHLERELRHRVPREEFRVVGAPDDRTFVIKGKNVGARVRVDDELVSIELDIPLLFVPFSQKIEAGVRDALGDL